MSKIKIYENPMTTEERSENFGNILKMPVRYHLVDCLKDLKFGRPSENQKQIDKWIEELNEHPENGAPFSNSNAPLDTPE